MASVSTPFEEIFMRAVWSLWCKPMRGAYRGGWPALRPHLLSWALSVQSCRRFFDSVHLVADSEAARLLVDGLGLEFDSVSLDLDTLDAANPDLWALGKLYAYRAQQEPFLHIDADAYLWKPPRGAPEQADVYAAYPEIRPYGQSYYRCASLKALVHRTGGWLPPELDAYVPPAGMMHAANCAVVGGNRLDFLNYYADLAIRAIEHADNTRAWAQRGDMMMDMLIFEQHMLTATRLFHAGRADSPFADVGMAYMFDSEEICARESGAAGFTHLISRAKDDPALLARLSARVARDHPEFFDRVMAIVPEAA
jgi:hypothetical protein